VVPDFDKGGNLPPGIHETTWDEITARFGTTPHRRELLAGLKAALGALRSAGCRRAYLNGSFATSKDEPPMITNERQYRITKAQMKKFDEATAAQAAREASPGVDSRIHAAMGDALRSEAEELRRQLHEYEQLRSGHVKARSLRSLTELPEAIIEARIAVRVTQKGLADRLGVAEQQVQRWEATNYAGVSVERIQDIADALGVRITEKVSFRPAARPARRTRQTTRTQNGAPRKSKKAAAAKSRASRRA
jgi:transcriptional regulator with XRE-family HTH domain